MWLIMLHVRRSEILSSVFGIADTTSLKRLGDTPSQISTLKSSWEHVVDNLDPGARWEESAHLELRYERMKQSDARSAA